MGNDSDAIRNGGGAPGNDGSRLSAPQISLPKGGGAIRGIDEKFAANPVTGTGSLNVPLPLSPGRSGFGPQLSVTYDSGSGNGIFGMGWSLSMPSITRRTDKGLPLYRDDEESDIFVLSGAEDLVPVLLRDPEGRTRYDEFERDGYIIKRYRPRIEGLFARIERWTRLDTHEAHWRSISKDNILTVYGLDSGSRIADPTAPERVYSWLICRSYDDTGNAIVYEYAAENDIGVELTKPNERHRVRTANRYPKRIRYGNRLPLLLDPETPSFRCSHISPHNVDDPQWMFEVLFDYGEENYREEVPDEEKRVHGRFSETGQADWPVRGDPISSFRSGFEIRTYRLCRRVLMVHHFPEELGVQSCLVRSTSFEYNEKPSGSLLGRVVQSGHKCREYGRYLTRSLPPLDLFYTASPLEDPDFQAYQLAEVDPESLANLPGGVDGDDYRLLDFYGEGVAGVLTEQDHTWLYKPNLGNGRFGVMETVGRLPSLAALDGGQQHLMDLTGDGSLDLVDLSPASPGFYERTVTGGWAGFRTFRSLPIRDWNDSNLRFVDLTGDGIADVLITEDDAFTWHRSLLREGFDRGERVPTALDENHGPRIVFADGTESIYLADMSGDGLSDIVRIRSQEICYWPNRGYGRFGDKITMDNAPWFDDPLTFDQKRIRLADTDGSGTTDVLYLGHDGVKIYLNETGNGWSDVRHVRQFPAVDNVVSITVADALGRGTACLLWSSPLPAESGRQLRYLDLMCGQKPHLLTRAINNLGAETRIGYASSTKFYLADKEAGTPWVTHLPFPVHVVERVETYDYVSRNRFVTRYTYHHGFYDGVEREFCGFGRVEQLDTEAFTTLTASDTFPIGDNIDAASSVPPVLTKTWFHTGVCLDGGRVSRHLAHEYYQEGHPHRGEARLTHAQIRAMLLDDTILPEHLTPEEAREACRSLKGSMLRQEIYALDDKAESFRPYSVTESNSTIRILQHRHTNRHAVFLTHGREQISFHYERRLFETEGGWRADPRVRHQVTLEVDDYGNVLKSVEIGYGRRFPDPSPILTDADRDQQARVLLMLQENDYTNPVEQADAHRTPLPAESRTYELLQMKPEAALAGVTNLFRFDELRMNVQAAADGAHDLPYEDIKPTGLQPGHPYRRLIERARTLFRPNDLGLSAGDPNALLPVGKVESHALAGNAYKLALTPGLVSEVYRRDGIALLPSPGDVLASRGPDGGGYVDLDHDGHWWVPSGRTFHHPDPQATPARELAEARHHFFRPRRFVDAFGNASTVDYDPHDIMVVRTTDPVGNSMEAANDYRVLQPVLLVDPNGNRAVASFDTLGLVTGTAVMGKITEHLGDSLAGFDPDPGREQIDAFFDAGDPRTEAPTLLGNATTRIVYDVDRWFRSRALHPADPTRWEPACAATLARETHAADPLPPGGLRIQVNFSYSDGFGREIQKKIQAEPGPAADGGPIVDPRWVGSGWTIFNNKGKPVRQYEPFFSPSHRFQFGVRAGVSPVLFYDPAERVIATLHPNHTFEKVVFDPWRQTTFDVNDTCAPRNAQTGDPRTDADIGHFVAEYFTALAAGSADPWQTWYAQRIGGALGPHEEAAARRAAAHADTPATAYFDSLGRPFLTVARNRVTCAGHDLDGTEDSFHNRVELDIEGNQRSVRDPVQQAGDPLGRIVVRYAYDMLGNRVYQISMEAGARWMLNDVAGKPIRGWDSRGHGFITAYDALRRPIGQYVRGTTAESDPRTLNREILVDRIEYGEGLANAEALNLRSRIYRHFDSAGVATSARLDASDNPTEAFDFKGNLLHSTRRLISDYKAIPDWSLNQALDDETFEGGTRYDALNRAIQSIAPHSSLARAKRNVIQPVFNEANLLERVDVWLERAAEPAALLDPAAEVPSPVGVANIDYDAKGQRQRIDYKNGASTFYDHDPLTFRLTRLYTRRGGAIENPLFPKPTIAAPDTPPSDCGLQNLRYTYDPAGNITHIQDDAQQTIYFRNERVEPSNDYTYDALYRLIQAAGREHLGQTGGVPNPPTAPDAFNAFHTRLHHPGDGNAMGRYIERYVYDAVGNFLQTQHRGSDPVNPGWTRAYDYVEASLIEDGSGGQTMKTSNRLTSTTLHPAGANPQVEPYRHDAHGNIVRMPHLGSGLPKANMHWDYRNQLGQTDLGGGGAAWYVYDISGQRIRKVWEKGPSLTEERIYLGGFEIFRKHGGPVGSNTVTLERETLHVMEDKRPIALVETRILDAKGTDQAPPRLIRYQFGNHLGSACLELDDQMRVISYEEYTPYGSSTYQAVRSQTETAKRYRYTAKERDEESGLYYHGARYYAAWLGRWVQCDPAGFVEGLNLYQYVSGNPVRFSDPTGFGPKEQELGASMETASEQHQEAANARRAEKKMGPVKVRRQEGVGGKRETIPDEVKTTPGTTTNPGGTTKVVETKARHVDSARNQSALERKKDIRANLEQVKNQLVELEKAGEIGPQTKGAALRVLHDSDKGASSAAEVAKWREEANAVRNEWVAAAETSAEKALRNRVIATTTTRASYAAATENLRQGAHAGGRAGVVIGAAIAAYILFDTHDAWAAAQSINPAANTADLLTSGNITVLGAAKAIATDAFVLTPPGAVTMLAWELMQPRGDNYYDEHLTERAIAEGRNPFCAQCHGPGGALDPNNEWNQRAQSHSSSELTSRFNKVDDEAMKAYLR